MSDDNEHSIGDGPIQADLHGLMNGLAAGIDTIFNGEDRTQESKIGWVLMSFPFAGHDGRCNYISNANREDIVVLMKHQVARFEGQPDIVGHA
jgi:hypothetical protein